MSAGLGVKVGTADGPVAQFLPLSRQVEQRMPIVDHCLAVAGVCGS